MIAKPIMRLSKLMNWTRKFYKFARSYLLVGLMLSLAQYSLLPKLAIAQIPSLKLKLNSVDLELKENDGNTNQLIITGPPSKDVSAFHVENPDRVVIDIPGLGQKRNITQNFSGTLIKSLRIGAHADKLRIVLDLKEPGTPSITTDVSDKISITIAKGAAVSQVIEQATPISATQASSAPSSSQSPSLMPSATNTPKQPSQSPSPAVTGTPLPSSPTAVVTQSQTATASPTAAATPVASKSETPEATATSTTSPTPSPKNTVAATPAPTNTTASLTTLQGRSISDLRFEFESRAGEKVSTTKIILSTRPEFQLARKSERTYLLSLSNCAVPTKFDTLPYFPPHDFVGFTHIIVEKKGSGAEVTIGTELGIRLSYLVKGNEIWLQPLNK